MAEYFALNDMVMVTKECKFTGGNEWPEGDKVIVNEAIYHYVNSHPDHFKKVVSAGMAYLAQVLDVDDEYLDKHIGYFVTPGQAHAMAVWISNDEVGQSVYRLLQIMLAVK